jgi:predicted PurR-regulated permease PerM
MKQALRFPFYAKVSLLVISLFFFFYGIYIGQFIIVPIVFATIVAVLLNPFVNFLIKKRIGKILAISIAVILTLALIIGIFYLASTQISLFRESYPQLRDKFNVASYQFINWFSEKFDIRVSKINAWTKETQNDAIDNFELGQKITEMGRFLMIMFLLPVYLFMILYYKSLLLEFVRKLFRSEHQMVVEEVLTNTKKIIQSYLVGLFFEMIIIAILNSAGLLLLGIDYAIILGATGAILNIIPYIGGIIGIGLPMVVAFVTKDSITYPLLVFMIYVFIQFVDNHYIIPKIVASRVQINALMSIIVVLIGGAVWGVPGMFLSIPLTAILKVIFDHIESLKPLGFLLGNIVPGSTGFATFKTKK